MIFSEATSDIKKILVKGEGWVTPYMGKIEWGHFTIEPNGVREPGFRIPIGQQESICGPVSSILLIKQKN